MNVFAFINHAVYILHFDISWLTDEALALESLPTTGLGALLFMADVKCSLWLDSLSDYIIMHTLYIIFLYHYIFFYY